jgi:hypothetical protein
MTIPPTMRFFGYIDPKRIIAALLLAGFEDKPITGLTFKDAAGRTWVDMHEVTYMGAIALAESSNNLFATHVNTDDSVDQGPLQINSIHEDLITPLCNPFTLVGAGLLARKIYEAAGKSFSPWNCTKTQPGRDFPEVANWYYQDLGLTRMRYASDGIALVRTELKNGRDAGLDDATILNRVTRFDLRDFSPYQK